MLYRHVVPGLVGTSGAANAEPAKKRRVMTKLHDAAPSGRALPIPRNLCSLRTIMFGKYCTSILILFVFSLGTIWLAADMPRSDRHVVVVVWDGLQAHRARIVQTFLAAHRADYSLAPLPAYAPELNPEELCNGAVKHALRNLLPDSVEELHQIVRREFRQLGRQPDVLRAFFAHAGLSVK